MSIIASTGCTPRSRATSDIRFGSFDIVSIRYTQSQSGGRASAPTMRGPLYGAFATSTSARLIDGSRSFAFCCASGRLRMSFHTSHLSNGVLPSNDNNTFKARECA